MIAVSQTAKPLRRDPNVYGGQAFAPGRGRLMLASPQSGARSIDGYRILGMPPRIKVLSHAIRLPRTTGARRCLICIMSQVGVAGAFAEPPACHSPLEQVVNRPDVSIRNARWTCNRKHWGLISCATQSE